MNRNRVCSLGPMHMRVSWRHHGGCRGLQLLHAAPQDLVGSDQHDAYDEGHGEGADEALPDAGLSVLFLRMHWRWEGVGRHAEKGREGERRKKKQP